MTCTFSLPPQTTRNTSMVELNQQRSNVPCFYIDSVFLALLVLLQSSGDSTCEPLILYSLSKMLGTTLENLVSGTCSLFCYAVTGIVMKYFKPTL